MHGITIQGLQRRILWLAVWIVLFTGTVVAVSVMIPMRSEMRAPANLHILYSLDVKRLAVDQFLSRLMDIARQLTSRRRR